MGPAAQQMLAELCLGRCDCAVCRAQDERHLFLEESRRSSDPSEFPLQEILAFGGTRSKRIKEPRWKDALLCLLLVDRALGTLLFDRRRLFGTTTPGKLGSKDHCKCRQMLIELDA